MLTGDIAQPTDMQPGTRPGANGNIVTLGRNSCRKRNLPQPGRHRADRDSRAARHTFAVMQ